MPAVNTEQTTSHHRALSPEDEQMKLMKSKKEHFSEFASKQNERSVQYSNLIMFAGYAAFFTVWSGLAPELPIGEKVLSCLFMILSVLIFISWEIYKMISIPIYTRKLVLLSAHTLTLVEFNASIAKLKKAESKLNRRNIEWWVITLIPSILCAVIALYFLVSGMFKVLDTLGYF